MSTLNILTILNAAVCVGVIVLCVKSVRLYRDARATNDKSLRAYAEAKQHLEQAVQHNAKARVFLADVQVKFASAPKPSPRLFGSLRDV